MADSPENVNTPRNIARAVVIKAGDLFFLSEQNSEVPAGNQDGFGLYYHDCRFLDGYNIAIAGSSPNVLVSSADRGSVAEFELTNETIRLTDKNIIPPQTFGIALRRMLDGDEIRVHDLLTIDNYDVKTHELPLSFSFQSKFEDIFEIRGLHPKKIGRANEPKWREGALILSYSGADGVTRQLDIHFEPQPDKSSGQTAEYQLTLGPGERRQLKFSFHVFESRQQPHAPGQNSTSPLVPTSIHPQSHEWQSKRAEIHSDSDSLNRVAKRSLADLGILQSWLDGYRFFSAGLPWYGALFGRDSIISALQALAYDPQIAEHTIRLLAKYQGTKTDHWRDEEPGKILHELRRGELANLNEIPQTPYYGAVDSTPLFLILIGEHANWTGDLRLFSDMRQHIERALHWIDTGGADTDGKYLSYASRSSKGLGNQGWKDSGHSIMNADGSLATPPISLVEVQGYVYRAKVVIAELYEHSGETDTASRLREEAAKLKKEFNVDFWVEDKQFYAIALQDRGRPAAVISSNPGQALWTGIVDENKAEAVVHHLTAEDIFSGWGIRTLSHREHRYNPIGYHLGTVWPHDNSIIAAGFHRYGFDREAASVLEAIVNAAGYFEHARLPEVFAGFSRADVSVPVRYPVACHPQAWAAGSVPFMVSSALGLTPDAFHGRLRVIRPVLPASVNQLDFRQLKIGDSTLDLRFQRTTGGDIQVEVSSRTGSVEVEVVKSAVTPKQPGFAYSKEY